MFIRSKTGLCIFWALALGALAGAGRIEGAGMQVPVLSKGIHGETLQRPGATPIHYAISIPAGLGPSSPVPLVLALHFAGDPLAVDRAAQRPEAAAILRLACAHDVARFSNNRRTMTPARCLL